MASGNFLKRICAHLGKNNKPYYVVMAIGTVKGICRPMFTMMDKTEDPETKKYTALREGLTEAIAVPVYFGMGKGMEWLAKEGGWLSKQLPKEALSRANKNLMFVGVCAAALFVIPALCSALIKPIMRTIQMNNTNRKPSGSPQQLLQQPLQPVRADGLRREYPQEVKYYSKPSSYGMKVGGV
jgi:hypothetical protein